MTRRAPAHRLRTPEDIWRRAALLGISFSLALSLGAHGGDILRGGAPAGSRGTPAFGSNPATTTQARNNAKDALARTTQAVQSVQAMQAAARAAAVSGPNNLGADPNNPGQQLPNVPNGLAPGGLQIAPLVPANLALPQPGENPALWTGAALPTQTAAAGRTTVAIKQTAAQALLTWKTFNVGKETTVNFDQSAGGTNKSQWIAFNKINDPSGSPSQILGSLKADGQVYVINQNGIIFGGSSQVNLRSLTASALPINDNLIKQGLLNNRDAQFLFSALEVPGGADGTPTFTPPAPLTPDGRHGDVVVKAGARISSEANTDGNGGRVMLVGGNVRNEGTISTPAGQTILAAGLQVAAAAHAGGDPSLRGLDVWVGAVGDYAGTVTNGGLIEATTGSALLAGRYVNQLGAIESTTSVTLNGRIDLLASYGAVANPSFDNPGGGFGGPMFFSQNTGVVALGPGSSTRILPDYASEKAVPGTTLPEKSRINAEGLAVHLQSGAMVLAPNGDVAIRAGLWPYRDADGNGTTLQPNGMLESGLASYYVAGGQRFLFSGGQIFLDPASFINVAGSTDVAVPLAHSILEVQFRGSEFADSPLQRDLLLRGVPLTVDIRRSGVSSGRFWMGTPLGDVTGLAGLIERNAAQLTAAGGNVTMQAGESIVVSKDAAIDVSGGFYQHEGGMVKTTRLLQNGRLVDIHNALPSQVYDGVYTGTFTVDYAKYGLSETYTVPWMTGQRFEQGYVQGASGGMLKMTAASMAIDGHLRGLTVKPPRSWAAPPTHSSLTIGFAAEKAFGDPESVTFLPASPTPPTVFFGTGAGEGSVPQFVLDADMPAALPADRLATVILSPELLDEDGFGHLSIQNTDGSITVPTAVSVVAPPLGSVAFAGANVTVEGRVLAPGGKLNFTVHNISPAFIAEFPLVNVGGAAAPPPNTGRGLFTLGSAGTLSTAGLIVDDRLGNPARLSQPLVLDGGSISIESFSAELVAGSWIDVSGGAAVSGRGAVSYGNAGSIAIRTGKDPGFPSVLGGRLTLASMLSGYSGRTGGALTVQAGLIQVGGTPRFASTLLLPPEFFSQGGFTSYTLEGIGAASDEPVAPGGPETYAPGIAIAPDVLIAPVAESWLAIPHQPGADGLVFRPLLKPAGQRSPVSLSFAALGADDGFTTDLLEVRGDLVMGAGTRIVTDPAGKVSFKGQTVTLRGSVDAPGGTITVAGGSRFAVPPDAVLGAPVGLPTVFIGPQAVLSTAGVAVFVPDAFGRRQGTLYSGGSISVSGNIVASAGAVLDVSGTSGIYEMHPTALGDAGAPEVPLSSGLNAPLWRLRTVPVRRDSSGGMIDLQGSQMLFTDAALLGRAGGPTATGGTLSVFSGRFYPDGVTRTSADANLTVTQNGRAIAAANTSPGVGLPVLDEAGAPLGGRGYFAANRFAEGGFDSLDLGFKFVDSSPISFGGNVEFQGPVTIAAGGNLRVAAGGVIQADAPVSLTAKYAALGQMFRAPLHPDDAAPLLFQQSPANPNATYFFAPTSGPGSLTVKADLIDLGTLSLQNVGAAAFIAESGDIRGNGTVQIAGELTLRAGQIYPTTLSTFNIFAYDQGGLPGSVAIVGSGSRDTPLSSGGALNIFASRISQGGVLRAPQGAITLGWDGTDFDPATTAADAPLNGIAGATIAAPVAQQVSLRAGSITSVAARSGTSGAELLLPFGLSPDGSSWIDPRGVNVTLNGLPEKRVVIAGSSVITEAGSTIDLRGGGDFYGYRWTPGTGGGVDLLGSASGAWDSGAEYQPGDLITFGGQTWSARVRHAGQSPTASLFWTQVAESYAVLPGLASEFAPYAPYNTGVNARLLGGDPGYVSSTLKLGDRIYLEKIAGLEAGIYTLLPRRYGLLPGAFLVTPTTQSTYGNYVVPEGANSVAGYRVNSFNTPKNIPTLRTQFEVASFDVVRGRASYDDYRGNAFFAEAAGRFDIARPQRMPIDAGYLAAQGGSALQLRGGVLADRLTQGRGAEIDISSFADIHVIGGTGTAPVGAAVVLETAVLNSWGAENLLIGGLRQRTADGTVIDVRTTQLVLNNPGDALAAPEVTIASKALLTVSAGSSVASSGPLSQRADTFLLSGDGTLLRVSGDAGAAILRTATTASTAPLMTIGAGTHIAGANVTLDSTYGTALDPTVGLKAVNLNLGSGQISLALSPVGALTGSVVPQHLVLSGQLLQDAQQVAELTLRSYRTIDIYGAGMFGSPALGRVSFLGGGLRGYDAGAGTALFQVGSVIFSNPSNVATLAAPAVTAGTLQIDGATVQFGANTFSVAGYSDTILNATGGVLGDGTGAFTTPGALTINAPLITGTRGSKHSVTAGGALALLPVAGPATVQGGLGASFIFTGTSVVANTAIRLPSGQLTLRATGAAQDISVGGELNVAGLAQNFFDITRYSDGGAITLTSDLGDVKLQAGSIVSVAAPAAGGNAGTVTVRAANGAFEINGAQLLGQAAAGEVTGSFLLDAGSVPGFDDLSMALNDGGFFEQRNVRVRTGDVSVGNPGGQANVARNYTVSADRGNILILGTIDASESATGKPGGGKIVLVTGGNLTVAAGSLLTVHAREFSSAGKGGEIRLEAGAAVNGTPNLAATLDVQTGSTIDLGVEAFEPGAFDLPGSSAFFGRFTGTLHLRAPRVGNDAGVGALGGGILGASSVVVEGYRLYSPASGRLDNALRTTIAADAKAYMDAGYAAMFARLTAGSPNAVELGQVLVIAPGVEVYNPTGDLVLGTAVSGINSEDWDLSGSAFRYGPKLAPGILTLRAKGDIVFNNTLSDGFAAVAASVNNGNSTMWLAPLAPIVTANGLPVNTQSWSYRIAAGSDLSASDFRAVLPSGSLTAGKGSVLVGEFYPAIPNNTTAGTSPGIGSNGTTENTIQITTGAANRTRFEVVRSGTGNIEIASGLDVQLRNQFATIYTAGVRVPTGATQIYAAGDFIQPIVEKSAAAHPVQGELGTAQQNYPAQWAIAGGSVRIDAQADIGRYTLLGTEVVADSSKQFPNNWLYRRGYVNPSTGLFAEGGVGTSGLNNAGNVSDASASTAWWIDYSNFFEGIGALGGGDVSLVAGSDIINLDAAIPTSARMPGRDPLTGLNLAPDASRLLEYGGGDLVVRAGANIDGGVYYVEKGMGILAAGGEIKTNFTRSPSLVYLGSSLVTPTSIIQSVTPDVYDPATWLPTTLLAGNSRFEVSARGNVLLGPVTNTFLLPQGANNKFWYKTYFNTLSPDAGATVASFGGSVTHRLSVTLPGETTPVPILSAWLNSQNLFNGPGAASRSSNRQPWIRLAETSVGFFDTQLQVSAPNLISTAFAGDINPVGSTTLFPSATGTLELAASGGILGIQVSGRTVVNAQPVTVWTSATLNLSDADPATAPGIASPIAYASFAGRTLNDLRSSRLDPFGTVDPMYEETGSFTGQAASIVTKQALHGRGLLHAGDASPVRIYAGGGDVSGFTLFAPKVTRVLAANDITDIAFYIQNVQVDDISIIAAGRDIVPNNANAQLRSVANDAARGNFVGDTLLSTVTGVSTNVLAGDLQITGPGVLEVLAGRNIDLGTEANFTDGTGVGITSIGNARNPNLPSEGSDLIVMAGVNGPAGTGPALGLSGSSLDFTTFTGKSSAGGESDSAYLKKLGTAADIGALTAEQEAIVGLETFYRSLRDAGRDSATTGTYTAGLDAVGALFGTSAANGEIFTRARDIRTSVGGAISLAAAGGGVTMASDIFGNPLTPPGIVTEFGGAISIFTDLSVDIGQARIFTLRGGDILMWSTTGDIAAGTAPKTVVTAPPTRVVIDATSADVQTDLGGLATGGGIGVLASVEGVMAGDVDLIAPKGVVDAGDAGIRTTGNLNIAATAVLNASNIQAGGTVTGAPSAPVVTAPSLSAVVPQSTAAQTGDIAKEQEKERQRQEREQQTELPSVITVEVVGYGGE